MKKTFKIIFLIILTVIFALLVLITLVWAYLKFYNFAYADERYGFIITNQRGWYGVPKMEGFYYQVGTADENEKTVSYFGVEPLKKEPGKYNEETYKVFAKSCKEMYANIGESNLEIDKVSVSNLDGYVCSFNYYPEKTTELYVEKWYLLFNKEGSLYDYNVTALHPKNDKVEEMRVERIVNSFFAL